MAGDDFTAVDVEMTVRPGVQAGGIDTDGISWKADALELNGGTIRQTINDTKDASLGHPAQSEAWKTTIGKPPGGR